MGWLGFLGDLRFTEVAYRLSIDGHVVAAPSAKVRAPTFPGAVIYAGRMWREVTSMLGCFNPRIEAGISIPWVTCRDAATALSVFATIPFQRGEDGRALSRCLVAIDTRTRQEGRP